ncbi:helix-turn-helix domain-containing protein [Arcicella lustrica]|uniref:Helix-turn-helix domain-containing protein n=1 Tax=Arcicella lustrica TaxID=2984196 RepID=A0ABU5SPP8_9BACT|nr:helix-turn-helix domain-containing protein [Arcicella sp. DC25W]MEA5429137.1 helix-turn-helix domain-containing protein [Arcicella sp. DC25W]
MNHYKTISELHQTSGYPLPEHPMMSLLTCQELTTCSWGGNKFTGDFYMISFKKIKSGTFSYGKTKYDHDNGSMSFVKPRQVVEINNVALSEKSFVIFIHEDYLLGHRLHNEIKEYHYFDYEANEALHLSPSEEQTIWELYHKIDAEYKNNQDEFSKEIILTHFDSILKYAQRFYKRQFITRTTLSGTMVSKFNKVLNHYFESGQLQVEGLPTVTSMAAQLNTSARYLSDLLKQETGKTALDHIHIYLIDEAKNLLLSSDNTIAETAFQLGFENPPYFTRLFKKVVGITPVQFKDLSMN